MRREPSQHRDSRRPAGRESVLEIDIAALSSAGPGVWRGIVPAISPLLPVGTTAGRNPQLGQCRSPMTRGVVVQFRAPNTTLACRAGYSASLPRPSRSQAPSHFGRRQYHGNTLQVSVQVCRSAPEPCRDWKRGAESGGRANADARPLSGASDFGQFPLYCRARQPSTNSLDSRLPSTLCLCSGSGPYPLRSVMKLLRLGAVLSLGTSSPI
jgi:hypothetical protein